MERRKAQGTEVPKIPNCDLFPGVAPICSHQVMHLWFSQSPNGGALSGVQVIYLPYNTVRAWPFPPNYFPSLALPNPHKVSG